MSTTNLVGGAQGNTGTQIIGSNPIIDNPLDPWWDIQGAVNQGNDTVKATKKAAGTVSGVVNGAKNATTAVSNISGALGNLQLWKGVGLILAGTLILLVVGLALVKG